MIKYFCYVSHFTSHLQFKSSLHKSRLKIWILTKYLCKSSHYTSGLHSSLHNLRLTIWILTKYLFKSSHFTSNLQFKIQDWKFEKYFCKSSQLTSPHIMIWPNSYSSIVFLTLYLSVLTWAQFSTQCVCVFVVLKPF